MMMWATAFVACAFLTSHVSLGEGNVTVTTSKGVVVGLRVDPSPNTEASYDAFLGIPYGQVPARFKPSVPRDNWSVPLVAHSDGPMCPQPSQPFNEDCLYLNVFTPVNASQFPGKYPVMAYIHGGGFTSGSSSSLQYGPDFLVPQGIILVTMNYRLGAIGFLTLGISEAPGNLGLYDTLLALKWIQQEISVFGGNPSQVTLFGHSSGSVLTLQHYISPASSGLFRSTIGLSGALSDDYLLPPKEAVRRTKLLSEAVGCNSTTVDNTTLLQCLQNIDINLLVSKQDIPLPVKDLATGACLRFVPVMDMSFAKYPFFPDTQENLMKKAVNMSKTLLTGFASGDGIVKFQSSEDGWKLVEGNLEAFIPWNLQTGASESKKTSLANQIKENYFPQTVDQNKILDLVNLYTDYVFAYPIIKMAHLFANFTYGYVYNYRGVWNPMPSYFSQFKMTGVFHGAELTYLFYTANSSQDLGDCSLTRDSISMRDTLVSLWTTFAKTGVPDPTGSWRPVSSGHYLLLDEPYSLINSSEVEKQHYQFWADLAAENNSSANLTANLIVIFVAVWTIFSMRL